MLGNTVYAAQRIAELTGADLLQIHPKKAYPDKGFMKFYWGGKSAVMAKEPELLPYEFHPERYDLIIFGTPVWAGTVAPPIRTFVSENREALKNRKTAAFVCCSVSGNRALKKMKELLGSEEFVSEAAFIDPKERRDCEEQIREFCRKTEG